MSRWQRFSIVPNAQLILSDSLRFGWTNAREQAGSNACIDTSCLRSLPSGIRKHNIAAGIYVADEDRSAILRWTAERSTAMQPNYIFVPHKFRRTLLTGEQFHRCPANAFQSHDTCTQAKRILDRRL